jgi:dTDP-4-dehydrorhamnose reductase
MKILVLGHTGLLGHMVKKYLEVNGYNVLVINGRWPDPDFKEKIKSTECDYIINCIGAIHQRTKVFDLNWEIPIWLDLNVKCRVIHPGTDCEMDDDDYGVSKRVAANYILTSGVRTKMIKTSILGPELNGNSSLMSWFLSRPAGSEVNGYDSYYWNGNTTLTWAKTCESLINDWNTHPTQTIIGSECISKCQILVALKEVHNLDINITPTNEVVANKCLIPTIKTPHIKQQLIELKEFYES